MWQMSVKAKERMPDHIFRRDQCGEISRVKGDV